MAKFLFPFFVFLFVELSIGVPHDEHGVCKHGEHEHDEHNRVHVPHLVLHDGHRIPAIGFGTIMKGRNKENEVHNAVGAAIDAGYRHIDTAENYETEHQVGSVIRNKIREGKVTREELFITTKLWNDHHRRDLVVPALRESLHKLGLDYVDLYLIHWPMEDFKNYTFGDTDFLDTWHGMVECQRLGLAKSIGVSNFNETQIERLINESHVKPAALQIEVNPTLTQKKLVRFCKEHGIVVIGYIPFGFLPRSKRKRDPPTIDDPILTEIAHKYQKNTFQIVLRYLVDRGVIPIPILLSRHLIRLREYITIFDFCLTPEEIEQIDRFNKDFRLLDVPEWRSHKHYPFHHQAGVPELP